MPHSLPIATPNSGYYLVVHADNGLTASALDIVIPGGKTLTLASLTELTGGLTLLDGAILTAPRLASVKGRITLGAGAELRAPLFPRHPSTPNPASGLADAPFATNRQDIPDGFHS